MLKSFKSITPRQAAAYDLLKWSGDGKIRYRGRLEFKRPENYGAYRRLVSDVIRHRRKYVFLIEELTGRKITKLDREVVVCLMLGISQLDQNETAEHAAVNETVNLVAALNKPFLKGFVNANLRSFIKKKRSLAEKLKTRELAIRTSHSDWMVQRWIRQYGKEVADSICEANNIPPQMRIVINSRFDKEDVLSELADLNYEISDRDSSGCVVVNPGGLFETRPAKSGAFLVQDSSYAFVNDLVKNLPAKRTLDACSAPGGKLFNLEWARGSEIEELIAADISDGRIRRMALNKKTFQSKAVIVQMNAAKPALKQKFDLILADVPCSATGIIRKHPEIKWDRRPADFRRNKKIQLSLLEGLKNLLVDGGHLLYITCSLEQEENQDVVETFLRLRGDEFRKVDAASSIDPKFSTDQGYCQCLPHALGMGSFGALIQKKQRWK